MVASWRGDGWRGSSFFLMLVVQRDGVTRYEFVEYAPGGILVGVVPPAAARIIEGGEGEAQDLKQRNA